MEIKARQTIDIEQVFSGYATARDELDGRCSGSVLWKTAGGLDDLYRKRRDAGKSPGPHGPETEATITISDARSYPLATIVPDPRAFSLHKLWLSKREDRDPLIKRGRDRAQAELIAHLVATRLPHLRFDDPALAALPRVLRDQAATLMSRRGEAQWRPGRLEPDW